jgi:PAS domain S-box-containing protein
MNWSIGHKATVGFAAALILIVIIGVSAYENAREFIETNQQVTQTVEVLAALDTILAHVAQAESSQRGYVITGYISYLDYYAVSRVNVQNSLLRLRELTIDNASQQESLALLEILIDVRFSLMDDAIESRRRGGFEAAQQMLMTGRGSQTMDNIRGIIQLMLDEEHRLLEMRRTQSEATAQNTFLTFAAFTLTAVGLLMSVFVLINREMMGRKRAEETARRYADEVQDLYDKAPCGYHSLGPDATFLQINQTELTWLGCTREEVVGKLKFSDVISSRSLPVLEANFPLLKQRGWVHDLEFEMKRKDGSTFMVLLNATAVVDENGQFVRTRSTLVDITDRKRAEEALRISEERWRSLVQNAPDIIITTDLDGCLQFVNRLPDNMPQEEVIGKSMYDVVLPEQREMLAQAVAHVRRTGEAASFEVTSALSGRHFLNQLGPIRVGGELVGFISTATDITERRKIEEQIKQLNRDLEQRTVDLEVINKELEAFTYSVSHDLRAPLRAMNGFSKQLHEKYGENLPEKAQHYLARIQQNSERMGNLIDDLLTLSRLGRQPLNLRSVNLRDIAQEVVRELNIAGEYPDARVLIDDLPACWADHTLMKVVYLNLMTNALKFSSKEQEPVIHLGFQQEPAKVTYFVKDNGVGFDMQFADKLFGVFERLHSAREFDGTGVGLATVQRIIHRHGGRVWAEAAPNEGATFYFTLQGEPESNG